MEERSEKEDVAELRGDGGGREEGIGERRNLKRHTEGPWALVALRMSGLQQPSTCSRFQQKSRDALIA